MTFKSGQVLSIRNSWAEMNEREVVSVVFQGQKAGGKIQRLFRVEGIDATSIDSCELYTQENGFPVNRTIIVEADETMGRTRSAKNFALVLEGKEAPLNVRERSPHADEDHRRDLRLGEVGPSRGDRLTPARSGSRRRRDLPPPPSPPACVYGSGLTLVKRLVQGPNLSWTYRPTSSDNLQQ